ncbi:MAG: hypothetical protein HUJ29_04405 [Gammaproteobacteria bacterium]|nr:hypothetical protein [Gammaproteobacteria bacterium]
MRKLVLTLSFLLPLLGYVAPIHAGEDDWLIGEWRLSYDPDNREPDSLIFKANDDVISKGPQGEYRGFYITSPGVVKAVLSVHEKDLILTFFHNPDKDQLRIVTSASGEESIYEKVTHE